MRSYYLVDLALQIDDLHLETLVEGLDVLNATRLGLQPPEDSSRQPFAHAALYSHDVAHLSLAGAAHQVPTGVPK